MMSRDGIPPCTLREKMIHIKDTKKGCSSRNPTLLFGFRKPKSHFLKKIRPPSGASDSPYPLIANLLTKKND
jgi:hypothetical protein